MGKFEDQLDTKHREFILAQKVFFVATAHQTGHINLSPKGIDTFRILDDHTVGYLDLTGSGNETAAHILADGRLTIMMCAFDGKPLIFRMYGRGTLVRPEDANWNEYAPLFPSVPGQRQIIILKIEKVQSSCGFGVPLYEFRDQREFGEVRGE